MATFNTTLHPTSFGFFDSDPIFQFDADRMCTFVTRMLGEDILSVELTKKMIWTNFENATREFNGMMIEYQARSNISSLLGMPTGSIDPTNGLNPNNINLTNMYVHQNLELLDRMAEPYSSFIGYGSGQESYSGSITLKMGVQDYDIYSELKDENGSTLYGLQPSGSVGKLQIYEVYHFAPLQYVFNSNMASNFMAAGMPVESYIPDTRFYVLPVFEDVLRAGMMKTAQRVRRSQYSYKISGRHIRIFPTPNTLIPGINDKLWIRVGYKGQPLPSLAGTLLVSGTSGGNGDVANGGNLDDSIYGASNPANIPFGLIDYKSLNHWARNWIAQYTLALCRAQLGDIRGKMNIPIPGAELNLNGKELSDTGRADMEKLMTSLKEKLENLTYDKIAEMEANKAENMVKQLAYVPLSPSWVIRVG